MRVEISAADAKSLMLSTKLSNTGELSKGKG
jgi:hypothetical protein